MKKEVTYKAIVWDGLLKNNPTFVQFLGMCPTLAVTTTVENAVGMGAGVIFVLVMSNLLVSLIRNFVTPQVRIPVYIVLISTLVTILEMYMRAYFYDLFLSLGIFLPLIVVNCIILGRAEAFAQKNTPLKAVVDGLSMGTGFTLGISLIASFRELFGAGTWFGFRMIPEEFVVALLVRPAGAFLVFGLLVALVTMFKNRAADKAMEVTA